MSDVEAWAVRGAVGAVVAAVAGLFVRMRANESRLAVIDKTLGRLEASERDANATSQLVIRIDERLKHLPTQNDMQLLHDRISSNGELNQQTARNVAAMAESIAGLRSAVDRLHDLEVAREGK